MCVCVLSGLLQFNHLFIYTILLHRFFFPETLFPLFFILIFIFTMTRLMATCLHLSLAPCPSTLFVHIFPHSSANYSLFCHPSLPLLRSLSLGLSWQVWQRKSLSPCLCGTSGSACWCVQSGAVSSWGSTLAIDMAVNWQFSPQLVSDHIVDWTQYWR